MHGAGNDYIYIDTARYPTGTTLTKAELKQWVDYALANDTLILFDAAYEAYIQEENILHSIYEIRGAKKCAHRQDISFCWLKQRNL